MQIAKYADDSARDSHEEFCVVELRALGMGDGPPRATERAQISNTHRFSVTIDGLSLALLATGVARCLPASLIVDRTNVDDHFNRTCTCLITEANIYMSRGELRSGQSIRENRKRQRAESTICSQTA